MACSGQTRAENADGPVYLAYAGPHASSPPSAFGHLFLVLPSHPLEPLPLWEVVSFAAHTGEAGPLRFVAIGIAGGFLGRYERREFHEKSKEYEILDDRDLWLIELSLSPAQRQHLGAELDASEGRWYPYTFFVRNCAYYLQALLAAVSPDIAPPQGITSPTGVVRQVLGSPLAGRSFFRPAISARLRSRTGGVSSEVVQRLTKDHWTAVVADTAWIAALSQGERTFVQEYTSWKAASRSLPLSDSVEAGFGLIRYLHAREEPNQGVGSSDIPTPGISTDAPSFHRYARISVGYGRDDLNGERASIRLRPAAHDPFDPWEGHRLLNSMQLLTVEASVVTRPGASDPRVDELILFSQRSLNPASWISPHMSWLLELKGRHGGLFDPVRFHGELRAGAGRTLEVSEGLYGFGLLTGAAVTDGRDSGVAAGVQIGMQLLLSRWRFGAEWREERSVSNLEQRDWELKGFGRYDVTPNLGVRAVAGQSLRRGSQFYLALDWYP